MLTNYMDGSPMHFRNLVSSFLVVTLAGGSLSAFADDYRAEVQLTADRVNPDGDSPDIDTFSATGTYYLEPVRTDGLPLAEAAFLGKSSYVSAAAARVDFGGDDDADFLAANFGYYMPNTIFFGRLGVAHAEIGNADDTNVNGSFGITPFDGLLLTTDFDEDGWDPNIHAKYVGKMANSHFYAVTVSAVDPDEGDTDVGVDFDYFLDTGFSVGAGYGSGDDSFRLRAQKFFTPSFAVGGNVSTSDGGDGFGASVTWRF
jgi:hypothetical protein